MRIDGRLKRSQVLMRAANIGKTYSTERRENIRRAKLASFRAGGYPAGALRRPDGKFFPQ
jgi:hypothetical protein